MKLKKGTSVTYYCFFYAPGEHHLERVRKEFYDDLRSGYVHYSKNDKIFMIGDSNARLGRYSLDRDIHGKFKTNKNKSLFLGFLSYSQMTYINGLFTRGIPTYEIFGKRKSIIDVCLTNLVLSAKFCSFTKRIRGQSPNLPQSTTT